METLFDLKHYTKAQAASVVREPVPLSQWAVCDTPVEKFIVKGPNALSDAELLAILIGGETPVEVARRLLGNCNQSLDELAKMTVANIREIDGIGRIKAVAIAAAMELSRRRAEVFTSEKPRISSSADAFNLLRPDMMDLPHEEFWVLCLNRANRVVNKRRVSVGGVSGTVADPRVIFKAAVECLACGIIVSHNHPSGNLTPSQSDIELTRRLKEAGKVMEIQLMDHVIISGNKYFSFVDEGLLT